MQNASFYLCLYLPRWPIQRLRAERAELRDGPLLLHRRDPRRGERIVIGCERAARAGIAPDLSLTDAAALLPADDRAHVHVLPYDPSADRAALGRLAEHCEQFSPRVGWDTVIPRTRELDAPARPLLARRAPMEPSHLFLNITGIPQLFGGEEKLAQRVVAACRARRHAVRVAIAPTIGAAWALAQAADPITIVPLEELAAALRPLPIARLRLPSEMVGLLGRLGIETIEPLTRLARSGLAERFGSQLLTRLDQAFGSAPEMIVPHRPSPRFLAMQRLEIPTGRREAIEWIIDELIDRIAAELQEHGRGALRLTGRLGCGPDLVAKIEVGMYRPTDLAKPLRELVRLHCERLALPGPVDRIALRAEPTVRMRPRQSEMFADPALDADRSLATLWERLSSRLGPEAVVRPVWQADPLPERAVRYVPLVSQTSRERERPVVVFSKKKQTPVAGAPGSPDHRPLRLLATPAAVEVVSLAPDGSPATFCWQQQRYVVARSWGPERIETGWWRRGLVRRDYYRIETTTGRRFWLYRDLGDDAWRLHGSFE